MKRSIILALAVCAISTLTFAQKKEPKITRAAAEKIALARESGTIKSGELEKEHGRRIYSFDIQTASAIHEVNVDANSGKIVEDSVESAVSEAKEAQQDATKPKS